MYKPIIIGLLSIFWTTVASGQQQSIVSFDLWQDSLMSPRYIGMEIHLDELSIVDERLPAISSHLSNTDAFLHSLGGVNMMRRGSFANEPMLRGLTSDRYLISIDGMRIFGACTDKMDPASAYVEPVNLKGLQVTFGGQPNEVGTGTGGAVNFQLKKPIYNMEQPVIASIQLNAETVANSFDQSADINWSKDKWAVRFSGVHRKSQNYLDGKGQEVLYSQFEKYNYAASLSYRLDEGMLNVGFVGDDAFEVGYPALPMDVSSARAKMIGVTYMKEKWFFLLQPELKVYYNFIDHVMDDTKRDSVAMHMDMPGNTWTLGGYLTGLIHQNSPRSLKLKLDGFKTFAHAEMTMYPNEALYQEMFMLTWPDVHRSVVGGEMSYYREFNKLSIDLSGRLAANQTYISSDFGERQLSVFNKSGQDKRNRMTHRLSAAMGYSLRGSQTLSLSLSSTTRVPGISEQFGFYLFNRLDGYDYLGDPDLKNEHNLHLELNYQVNRPLWSMKAAVFSYRFSNYIMGVYSPGYQQMTIGSRGVKWYTNTDHAEMVGGEISSNWSPTDQTFVNARLSSVYGWDYESKPLPQMPPLKIEIGLQQEVAGFMLSPEWTWSAAQRRASSKFVEQTTNAFHLVNLKLSKTITAANMQYSFDLGVENLFDAAYREHFDIGSLLRPGRNFHMSTRLKF